MRVFCDLLQLSLPIRHDPRWSRGGAGSVEMHGDQLLAALDDDSDWDIDESVIAGMTGFGLSARDVQIAADGTVSVTRLQFNWDSLPSSYTGIGVRIAGRHRGRGDSASSAPRMILRASPGNLLQAHNVYSDIFSLSDAFQIMIERAIVACPEIVDLCDPADALVDEVVAHLLSFALGGDDAGFAEQGEVLGDARLGEAGEADHFADGGAAAAVEISHAHAAEHAQAIRVGQKPEHAGHLVGVAAERHEFAVWRKLVRHGCRRCAFRGETQAAAGCGIMAGAPRRASSSR